MAANTWLVEEFNTVSSMDQLSGNNWRLGSDCAAQAGVETRPAGLLLGTPIV